MATHKLQRNLIELMPRARRYARALIGDTEIADTVLSVATLNVIKQAPDISLLTPYKMILPWLFIELHKEIDLSATISNQRHKTSPYQTGSTLHEQVDSGLKTLSNIQKRAYLLTVLEQFPLATTAHVLGQPIELVKIHFNQAHVSVYKHVNEHFTQQSSN